MKLKTLVLALGMTSGALMLSACGDKGQQASNEAAAPAEQAAAPATQAAEKQTATEAAQSASAAVGEKVEAAKQAVAEAMTPAIPAQPKPPADKGAEIYGQCVGCHGPTGGGGVGPKLSGQSKDTLASTLKDYKAGKQIGPQTAMMAPIAQGLSDEDIEAVANYIATNFK
ncbi:Cytochrome c553 [Sulfurivirga caldicuralii]|uniref:Cytochrome c553 n=1 Tax=Sulfurivirga caldicuralii TaxID=364032 RepID=A0A1N6F5U3_9GAMM|nr:c-type cytochrome [Sulfurivirga caldicuralii]SIN90584.1 Cytochrome c553 [Sulfurivirga caldicuralii]